MRVLLIELTSFHLSVMVAESKTGLVVPNEVYTTVVQYDGTRVKAGTV